MERMVRITRVNIRVISQIRAIRVTGFQGIPVSDSTVA
jgi:hypothetical protein